MISLLFLLCNSAGCINAVQDRMYRTEQECQLAAETTIAVNKLSMQRGEVTPHTAIYQCVKWGEAA